MENPNDIKNIDLSQLTDTELSYLHLQANSIYGDGKYLNTPEYKKIYNEMRAELQRRSTINQ